MISFTVLLLLQQFLLVASTHTSHAHLKKPIPLMLTMPFSETEVRHLEVFQFPVFVVLACFTERVSCASASVSSSGRDELACVEAVMGKRCP